MDVEELETIVEAMAEEGGDQIDALYDTVTLQKDTYCGFIDRLREVVRKMKLHNEEVWRREQAERVALSRSVGAEEAMRHRHSCDGAAAVAALAKVKKLFDGRIMWQNEIRGAHKAVEAALGKPPRNCDVFGTKDTTREAFQKLRGHRVWADVSLWDDRDEIEAYLDWLFAPATEWKGGAS